MLNADGVVWFEKVGVGMQPAGMRRLPVEAERMLRVLASEMLVELNVDHPSLRRSFRRPWGARVQASIPLIVDPTTLAIRKPARVVFSLADYVQKGILTPRQEHELLRAVHDNILIGGGTGSGNTTFANALLKVIADGTDRLHIIENTPELQCEAPNKVQILVQPPVRTWRDAVMAAMRHRPDWILVGEVRDGSALELLKAWNTGHPEASRPSMPTTRRRCSIGSAGSSRKSSTPRRLAACTQAHERARTLARAPHALPLPSSRFSRPRRPWPPPPDPSRSFAMNHDAKKRMQLVAVIERTAGGREKKKYWTKSTIVSWSRPSRTEK
jgi:Flp pilus assembly CpaF family ATPase